MDCVTWNIITVGLLACGGLLVGICLPLALCYIIEQSESLARRKAGIIPDREV
jgi:hypothetical protein